MLGDRVPMQSQRSLVELCLPPAFRPPFQGGVKVADVVRGLRSADPRLISRCPSGAIQHLSFVLALGRISDVATRRLAWR